MQSKHSLSSPNGGLFLSFNMGLPFQSPKDHFSSGFQKTIHFVPKGYGAFWAQQVHHSHFSDAEGFQHYIGSARGLLVGDGEHVCQGVSQKT